MIFVSKQLVLVFLIFMSLAGPSMAWEAPSLDVQIAKSCPAASVWLKRLDEKHEAELKSASPEKVSNPALRAHLIELSARDEAARNRIDAEGQNYSQESLKNVQAVDAVNLTELRKIVSKQGFPTHAQVGKDGVDAAFNMAQHADTDRALQGKILESVMQRDAGSIDVDRRAMLYDRVALATGKPQRYGSQLNMVEGKLIPREPIEDVKSIDGRRASVGLMPLSDYVCMLNSLQHLN